MNVNVIYLSIPFVFYNDLTMAYQPNRRRHPASKALIEFREVLGMTQAEFANRLLKVAAITLSLYETTRPPDSELLRKLKGIAKREAERCEESDPAKFLKLKKIEQKFHILLIEEASATLRELEGLRLFRATDEDPLCAYVFLRLDTIQAIVSMETLIELSTLADPRSSSDPKARDAAAKAIEELNKALQKIKPGIYEENLAEAQRYSSPPRLKITNEPEGTTK
jgi:transcriptional regulator with XRE-family HTH domain